MKLLAILKRYKIFAVLLVIMHLAGFAAAGLYAAYMHNEVSDELFSLHIAPNTTFDSLAVELSPYLSGREINKLRHIVKLKGHTLSTKPGYYEVTPNTSTYALYTKLAAGLQTPVKLVFNNIRTQQQLADRVGEQLMLSSDQLMELFNDTTLCASYGFTTENIGSMFIPNTYEFYWTVSPQQFMKRMNQHYDTFWNEHRTKQLEATKLTQLEVSILASIVEEETKAVDEMPIVAGLYLNRLRIGMPLQADPTVKFALQEFDLKRILFTHLSVDSPYNTYKHKGLPPGQIRIPSPTAIDAVLNYAHHKYLYMCAKEDLSGKHNFARTLGEHGRNANRYRDSITKRNIR